MHNLWDCWLHHCACRREKQVQDLSRIYHSDRENSAPSSSRFRASTGRLVAMISNQRSISREPHFETEGVFGEHQEVRQLLEIQVNRSLQGEQEALSKLSEMEHRTRFLLEEQRNQTISEANSKYFCRNQERSTLLILYKI